MRHYTNTQRITISDKMKNELNILKSKYNIIPTHFIRIAIEEKLRRENLEIKVKCKDLFYD